MLNVRVKAPGVQISFLPPQNFALVEVHIGAYGFWKPEVAGASPADQTILKRHQVGSSESKGRRSQLNKMREWSNSGSLGS